MSWENIFKRWPRYSEYRNNKALIKFYNELSAPENVEKMIFLNDNAEKPPVVAVIDLFDSLHSEEEGERESDRETAVKFNLNKNKFIRQFLGSMISQIFFEYGYRAGSQKNINILNFKYFKSGTHYQKAAMPAERQLRKKVAVETGSGFAKAVSTDMASARAAKDIRADFAKFWKKYGLTDKLKEIMLAPSLGGGYSNGSSLIADTILLKDSITKIFPFHDFFMRHERSMHLTSCQLASMLELKYPGIIGLSGAGIEGAYPEFIELLSETLAAEAAKPSNAIEHAYISEKYQYMLLSPFGGQLCGISRPENKISIFRHAGTGSPLDDPQIQYSLQRYDGLISGEFFNKYDVLENILKILKETAKVSQDETIVYFTLHQLIMALAENYPIKCSFYPPTCIFYELLKLISKDKNLKIKCGFLSGTAIANHLYSYKIKKEETFLDGTSNYVPIFYFSKN